MKIKNLLLTMAMTAFCAACEVETEVEADDGFGSGSSSINDTILEGEVAGRSWTFISGRAKPSLYGDGTYSVAFWDEDISDPCDPYTFGSDAKLLGLFPMTEGTHELGNSHNINFAVDSQNNISTNGRMVITEIDGDTVYGKMIATFDNTNYVNGTFELTLCE